jgi:hypothetical protein
MSVYNVLINNVVQHACYLCGTVYFRYLGRIDSTKPTEVRNSSKPAIITTVLPPYPAGFLPAVYPGNMSLLPVNYGAKIATSDKTEAPSPGSAKKPIFNIPLQQTSHIQLMVEGEDEVDPVLEQPPQPIEYIKKPSLFSILKPAQKEPAKEIVDGRGGIRV